MSALAANGTSRRVFEPDWIKRGRQIVPKIRNRRYSSNGFRNIAAAARNHPARTTQALPIFCDGCQRFVAIPPASVSNSGIALCRYCRQWLKSSLLAAAKPQPIVVPTTRTEPSAIVKPIVIATNPESAVIAEDSAQAHRAAASSYPRADRFAQRLLGLRCDRALQIAIDDVPLLAVDPIEIDRQRGSRASAALLGRLQVVLERLDRLWADLPGGATATNDAEKLLMRRIL